MHGLSEEAEASVHMPHYVSGEREGSVAFFARDDRTGSQVWSARTGYPGDPCYLDFHKKRLPGALRYWRVTGPDTDMADKLVYDPEEASRRTSEHAAHFAGVVRSLMQRAGGIGRPRRVRPVRPGTVRALVVRGGLVAGQVIEALDAMRTCSWTLFGLPGEASAQGQHPLPEAHGGAVGFHQIG